MKSVINFRALAITLAIALIVSYLVCIVVQLVSSWRMDQAWAPLLPGFTWPLTLAGFLIGLVWLVVYSVWFAALIAFPYNYFSSRLSGRS